MDFIDIANSPLAYSIKEATLPSLASPDYSRNYKICDIVSRSGSSSMEHAIRCLGTRLADSDPVVVYLTLNLVDSFFDYCGLRFARELKSQFLDSFMEICNGNKGDSNALLARSYLRRWCRAFEYDQPNLRMLFQIYFSLESRMPSSDEGGGVASHLMGSTDAINFRSDLELAHRGQSSVIRLEADLQAAFDKIKLCRRILRENKNSNIPLNYNRAPGPLFYIIGYLEACRDRFRDIFDADSSGILDDRMITKCHFVNKALLKTLDDERHGKADENDDDFF